MSQSTQILNHLESGKTITAIEALNKFGCFRLAARILELRYSGNEIHSEQIRQGEKTFSRYTLTKK